MKVICLKTNRVWDIDNNFNIIINADRVNLDGVKGINNENISFRNSDLLIDNSVSVQSIEDYPSISIDELDENLN